MRRRGVSSRGEENLSTSSEHENDAAQASASDTAASDNSNSAADFLFNVPFDQVRGGGGYFYETGAGKTVGAFRLFSLLRPNWGESDGVTDDGRPVCSFSLILVPPLTVQSWRDEFELTKKLNAKDGISTDFGELLSPPSDLSAQNLRAWFSAAIDGRVTAAANGAAQQPGIFLLSYKEALRIPTNYWETLPRMHYVMCDEAQEFILKEALNTTVGRQAVVSAFPKKVPSNRAGFSKFADAASLVRGIKTENVLILSATPYNNLLLPELEILFGVVKLLPYIRAKPPTLEMLRSKDFLANEAQRFAHLIIADDTSIRAAVDIEKLNPMELKTSEPGDIQGRRSSSLRRPLERRPKASDTATPKAAPPTTVAAVAASASASGLSDAAGNSAGTASSLRSQRSKTATPPSAAGAAAAAPNPTAIDANNYVVSTMRHRVKRVVSHMRKSRFSSSVLFVEPVQKLKEALEQNRGDVLGGKCDDFDVRFLDGSMTDLERLSAVSDAFNLAQDLSERAAKKPSSDPRHLLFIVSEDCGVAGYNLSSFQAVYFLTFTWNLPKLLQGTGRVRRLDNTEAPLFIVTGDNEKIENWLREILFGKCDVNCLFAECLLACCKEAKANANAKPLTNDERFARDWYERQGLTGIAPASSGASGPQHDEQEQDDAAMAAPGTFSQPVAQAASVATPPLVMDSTTREAVRAALTEQLSDHHTGGVAKASIQTLYRAQVVRRDGGIKIAFSKFGLDRFTISDVLWIVLRVSSLEQLLSGTGISKQVCALLLTLLSAAEDEGTERMQFDCSTLVKKLVFGLAESSFNCAWRERPSLAHLLSELEKKDRDLSNTAPTCILLADLTRLARDFKELVQILGVLDRYGVKVLTLMNVAPELLHHEPATAEQPDTFVGDGSYFLLGRALSSASSIYMQIQRDQAHYTRIFQEAIAILERGGNLPDTYHNHLMPLCDAFLEALDWKNPPPQGVLRILVQYVRLSPAPVQHQSKEQKATRLGKQLKLLRLFWLLLKLLHSDKAHLEDVEVVEHLDDSLTGYPRSMQELGVHKCIQDVFEKFRQHKTVQVGVVARGIDRISRSVSFCHSLFKAHPTVRFVCLFREVSAVGQAAGGGASATATVETDAATVMLDVPAASAASAASRSDVARPRPDGNGDRLDARFTGSLWAADIAAATAPTDMAALASATTAASASAASASATSVADIEMEMVAHSCNDECCSGLKDKMFVDCSAALFLRPIMRFAPYLLRADDRNAMTEALLHGAYVSAVRHGWAYQFIVVPAMLATAPDSERPGTRVLRADLLAKLFGPKVSVFPAASGRFVRSAVERVNWKGDAESEGCLKCPCGPEMTSLICPACSPLPVNASSPLALAMSLLQDETAKDDADAAQSTLAADLSADAADVGTPSIARAQPRFFVFVGHSDQTSATHPCTVGKCGLAFTSESELRQHISWHLVHASEKRFRCTFPDCLFDYALKHSLEYHMQGHVGENQKPCCNSGRGCQFSHCAIRARNRHEQTQCEYKPAGGLLPLPAPLPVPAPLLGSPFPWACPYRHCRFRYPTRNGLASHMQGHVGENQKPCCNSGRGCQFSHCTPNARNRHEQTQCEFMPPATLPLPAPLLGSPFPWACPYRHCRFRYSRKDTLASHMQGHVGENQKPCCNSGRGCQFSHCSPNARNRHEQTHCEYKPAGGLLPVPAPLLGSPFPWACPYPDCGFRYSTKPGLASHMQGHVGENQKPCCNSGRGCQFSHCTPNARNRHEQTHCEYKPPAGFY